MKINDYGWQQYLEHNLISKEESRTLVDQVARVAIENKTNFTLVSNSGELSGLILGKFRKLVTGTEEFPKVGDWVKIEKLPNEDKAVITEILPRATIVARKAAGEGFNKKPQIIATNIDVLFIVAGMDQDFNAPLLNRYLAMAQQGGVKPVIIANKSDLVQNKNFFADKLNQDRGSDKIDILTVSAKTGENLSSLHKMVNHGLSFALVGPSGSGKSSIVNRLIGEEVQTTGDVRESDGKGRHTTTKREMFLLSSGGILIDTPGIRELENLDDGNSSALLFPNLSKLAEQCRYRNCDHDKSKGCAIRKACEEGSISTQQYNEFLKTERDYSRTDAKTNHSIRKAQQAKAKAQQRNLRQVYKTRKPPKR